MGMLRTKRHSMLTGARATRGAATFTPGAASSPATANSSTSGGNSPDVMFICSARSSSTTLTTKLPVLSTLRSVSFLAFAPGAMARAPEENAIVGGSPVMAMKKLNGATFLTPSASTVDTQAMGRGTTHPMSSLYTASASIFSGSSSTRVSSCLVGPARPRGSRPRRRRVAAELRHHVLGEPFHRAAPQRGAVPVVAAHEERAEVARLLAQRHELVEDSLGGARDDQALLDHVHRHVLVGNLEIGLQHEQRLAPPREAEPEERVVVGQAAAGIGEVVLRLGLGLRDEHAAGHAPDIGVGPPPRRLAALRVLLPVAAEVAPVEELAGHGDPPALARRPRAARVGREQRQGDGRMRLLQGTGHPAHLEVGPDVVGEPDRPEAAVDLVRRILSP